MTEPVTAVRRSVLTRFLDDDEAERLYRLHPGLGRSPDDYCPTCGTAGTYRWRGRQRDCDCAYQLQLHKHYLAAGVGVTYQRLDWTDFDGPDAAVEGAARYLDRHEAFVRRGVGLYLSGSVGTGKTMLANLMVKEMVKSGYTCYATTFAQTVEMFTAGWGDRAERDYFQRKFLRSQILLLDDVGRELRGTRIALAETTFDAVLRTRVQEGRPTFVTTNLTGAELERGYGAAILSLLREKSLEEVFTGDDYRVRANARELDEIARGEVRPIV